MARATPRLVAAEEWWPHDGARPLCSRTERSFRVAGNGTELTCGGWQLVYEDVSPGDPFTLSLQADLQHVDDPWVEVLCTVHWGLIDPRAAARRPVLPWDYLPLVESDSHRAHFRASLTPPPSSSSMTLRVTLRWAPRGELTCASPRLDPADPETERRVKVSVVSGSRERRRALGRSLTGNHEMFDELSRAAADGGADLIVLPELAAHYKVGGHPIDLAEAVPGRLSELYGRTAQASGRYLLVGMYERLGDSVYNSAVLLGRDGRPLTVFRKTHLAVSGENESGIRPSPELVVSDVEFGRLGCAICADVSYQEVARVVSLLGAELIMLPIEGDSRANRQGIGPSRLDEDRWRAILITRAMDNDCVLAVARNAALGSCIIDCDGAVLAYNDGNEDFVSAEVTLGRRRRARNGGDPGDVQRIERRPRLYGEITRTGPRP